MWLLPSRGRPKECQEAIDACTAAGMTSRAVVSIDTRISDYPDLVVPKNWTIDRSPLDMADAMRWALDRFPNDRTYGWLSDDLRPVTEHWDKMLEKAAEPWSIVCCYEGADVRARNEMTGAMCWGGELVRTVGWWALPGVRQAGIDDAWYNVIGHQINNIVRLKEVEVRHLRKGVLREHDDTDSRERDGEPYIGKDFDVFGLWRNSKDAEFTVNRIRRAMAANSLD